MASVVVNSVELVQTLIEEITTSSLETPFLFIDLEGTNLSRQGSIAIMQILVPPKRSVYLVDISTLGGQAFETKSAGGTSLKDILESERFPKVFFDVRNDSDALYSHYDIRLKCVVDIQLLEFASRRRGGRFLCGLAKCISYDCPLSPSERQKWQDVKEAGVKLFAPEKGGSYDVFHQRPLLPAIASYCAQDVLLLPVLLTHYAGLLSEGLARQIQPETTKRVGLSQSPSFNGKGRHMAIGPSFEHLGSYPHLVHPMKLIMSSRLASFCTLNAHSELGTVDEKNEQLQKDDIVAALDNQSSDTVQSPRPPSDVPILENMASLQIESA